MAAACERFPMGVSRYLILPYLLTPPPPCAVSVRRCVMTHPHIGARYYGRVQSDLRKLELSRNVSHPCLNRSAHACAASFVAAVTASRLDEAHAATHCRKVLPPRDCYLPKKVK